MKRTLFILAVIVAVSRPIPGATNLAPASEAAQAQALAERLGYPRGAKLLIVHADDLGMAHSVNDATVKAFETGLVSSGSIMVPCPWFPEIAAYARSHPDADLGLHLTLTSEWRFYRWGPVSAKDQVASLLEPAGYLYPTESEAAAHIDPREVEAEIRAQVERARAFGIRPTHLDSHMGTLYQNKALFQTLLRVSHDYGLPVMISREWFTQTQFLPSILGPNDIVIDHVMQISPDVPPERWAQFYVDLIKGIQPGVNEMIVHLAHDDEEMRAATIDHPDWGAGWRQRDFNFVTSEPFRRLLDDQHVKLITWREIGKLLAKPRS